jgi:hypothetical protein
LASWRETIGRWKRPDPCSGQAAGVLLERLHDGGVAGEFDGALVEGEVELGGEGGDIGGGGAEEAAEGAVVAGAEAVVADFVGRVGGGGEGGFGGAVASEGAVPISTAGDSSCRT